MEQTSMFRAAPAAVVPVGDPDRCRPYQRSAVDAIREELKRVRSTMLAIPCGTGKTHTASVVAKHWPDRVLWLAGTDFLLDQARAALEDLTRELVTVEKADLHMGDSRIVVASVQTLKLKRLLRHDPNKFGLIIYDEASGAVANVSRKILEHFASAKVLGLDATPYRLDKKAVHGEGGLFETIAYRRDADFAMDEGYLCKPIPIIEEIKGLDLSHVRSSKGDLLLSDLEEEILKSAGPIAKLAWKHSDEGKLPAIIYTPGVASAKAVADMFNAEAEATWGPGACIAVDGESDQITRRHLKKEFGKKIRAVANCNLLTRGVDLPLAQVAILGRLTKSLALFTQMALRPARTLPGIGELPTRAERLAAIATSSKPNFRLVDIAGNSGKHTLTSVVSLGGKDLTPLEEKHVKKRIQERPGFTLDEAIEEGKKSAAAELREVAEREAKKLAAAAKKAALKSVQKTWDPFSRLGAKFDGEDPAWLRTPPTADQVIWCRTNGICRKDALPPKELTRGAVAKLQRQANEWRRQGMANFKQRKVLANAGLPVDVRFSVASDVIDVLIKNGYHANRSRSKCLEIINGYEPGAEI